MAWPAGEVASRAADDAFALGLTALAALVAAPPGEALGTARND